MRYTLKAIFLAAAAVLAMASCAEKEPETVDDEIKTGRVCLKISDVVTSELAKSVIKGTSFPTDEDMSIGIFLRETKGHIGSTGSREYDYPYYNIKFTRAAGQTEWVPEKEMQLSADTVCVVYAYYPWKDGTISDHIDVYPSVDGDDWMWGTPVEDVSSANPEIKLTMNHALALVEITFNISNHSEDAKMTHMSVSSPGAARYSSLNFKTGGYFPYGKMTGDNALAADVDYPINEGVIKADCLLVPAGTSASRQDMTISCTLAGKTYTANLSGTTGVIIKQGVKSSVSLNIKGSTMEVASVGIGEWNSGETISKILE